MKTILTKLTGAFFCLFLSVQLFAQDIIQTNLTSNPVVNNTWNDLKARALTATPTAMDTLPFLDDFSYPGPYPDTTHWLDRDVFINRTYPYSPPTIGVATFDGLNEKGYPYNFIADQNSSGPADTLTSKLIDLAYPASDSIYLSFYYQPQGRGNSPAAKDSLILEFKSPSGTTWDHIWSKTGSAIVYKDTLSWKLIMVSITNPAYLQKGFQFRFRNYATLSGNLDHWHIDYVYLKTKRTINDNFSDIAYVYDHPSLIKTYQVMPWRQYVTAFAKDSVITIFRNNYVNAKNTSTAYVIKDEPGNPFYNVAEYALFPNVDPFSVIGYQRIAMKAISPFPLMTKPTSYFVQAYIKSPPDIKTANDTLRYEQKFGNYFAYDDGTAESAFGITKPDGQLAVKFELNVADTLRYVDIYFNPILTDAALYTFNLKVWNDEGLGRPGTEIFSGRTLIPRYTKTGINGIIRYGLDAPMILPKGIFYVGFTQTSNKPLNVGLDLNTNNQYNIFYNTGGGWNTMPYPGSAIIHPVFGSDSTVISISELDAQKNAVEIYPNPASNELNVRALDFINHQFSYSIIDVYGREVENKTLITPATIDISALSKGIYFIRMAGNKTNSTFKFIKIE